MYLIFADLSWSFRHNKHQPSPAPVHGSVHASLFYHSIHPSTSNQTIELTMVASTILSPSNGDSWPLTKHKHVDCLWAAGSLLFLYPSSIKSRLTVFLLHISDNKQTTNKRTANNHGDRYLSYPIINSNIQTVARRVDCQIVPRASMLLCKRASNIIGP